jgi:hypothetical protein
MPGREIQPFLQEQYGYGEPRESFSEREMEGHERAAAGGSPHFCQLVNPKPRRSEKVTAGVLNQYGARFTSRALWSPVNAMRGSEVPGDRDEAAYEVVFEGETL